MQDAELIDRLQRGAFGYFVEHTNPKNGLVADTSREGAPASIAVVGMGLSVLCVAAERGWLSREDAAARALVTLRFFERSPQGPDPAVTGYRGFYYHFLDRGTGQRVWRCELSPIDTALLLAGVLTVGAYFTADTADEKELRALAGELYGRVDWDWARNGQATLAQGWVPESGFYHYGWEGYSEASLLYVLALASPTHAVSAASLTAWSETYQWEHIYDSDVLYAGPLFIHQFSHAWIDFRKIQDAFMRDKGSDYFENTRRAIDVQREYARRDPKQCGYGVDCWGLSAGDGPSGNTKPAHGRERIFLQYSARGVPFGPDDGTICPASALASLPFAPEHALSAVRHFFELHPEWMETWRLPSGFNQVAAGPDARGWVSEGFFGLDQGLVALMIENHRSGLLWRLMRECPAIRTGLQRAGFEGGWL
jgi:hypothetical protein